MDFRKVLINTHMNKMMKELDNTLDFTDGETKAYCEELFKTTFTNIIDDYKSHYDEKLKTEGVTDRAITKDKDTTIDKLIDILMTMKSPESLTTSRRSGLISSPLTKSRITKLSTLDDSGKKIDGRSENSYNKLTHFIKLNYNDCKENPLPKGKKLVAKDYSKIWAKIKTLTDVYDEEVWCNVIEEYIGERDGLEIE